MKSTPNHDTQLPLSAQEVSAPIIEWWLHHWMGTASPVARMQVAWMETLYDAMRLEAELLTACAASQQQIFKCLSDQQALKDPVVMSNCYQDVLEDFINAHLHRMDKVNEMAEDFRQRVWEEI